ncbi:MAG: VOC family protein [Betaproteobacteria bacterium]|nr:VOC family protein [Betaproteobacteria bacterium]
MLRFVVSDRGKTIEQGIDIVFMTRDPAEHHQLVIAAGRPADLTFSTINQISFRVDSLQSLRELHERLQREPGVKTLGPVTHGNAVSLYFQDPEGNRVECLIDTPWHVPQPYRIPVDLSQSDEAILAKIEKDARATPGFKPMEEWKAEIARKIAAATTAP